MSVEPVSVDRAAHHLGVTPMQVCRLIRNGELVATRFGRAWIVDPESLARYAASRPGRGRPLAAREAWRRLLQSNPTSLAEARLLANACRRRALRRPVRVLPGELDGALADDRLILGGTDAALAYGAAIGLPQQRVGYVRAADAEVFVDDHFGEFGEESANLVLRVVDDGLWPFNDRLVPRPVAVIDLIDLGDVRSAAEAMR